MKKLLMVLFCVALGFSYVYSKVYKIHNKMDIVSDTFIPYNIIKEFVPDFKDDPLDKDATTIYNTFLNISNGKSCSKNRISVRGGEETVCKQRVCQFPFFIRIHTFSADVEGKGNREIFYAVRVGAPFINEKSSYYSLLSGLLDEIPNGNRCAFSESSVVTSSIEVPGNNEQISRLMGHVVVSKVKTESKITFPEYPNEQAVNLVCEFTITSYSETESNITQECRVNNEAEILQNDIWKGGNFGIGRGSI